MNSFMESADVATMADKSPKELIVSTFIERYQYYSVTCIDDVDYPATHETILHIEMLYHKEHP